MKSADLQCRAKALGTQDLWCPTSYEKGRLFFLFSFFLNRWYIMTRLPWQWICMNNVAVLYSSKSYFVLKHSQMVFVQFWSLKILPAWQKFGCSNPKEVMHPVGQETLSRTARMCNFRVAQKKLHPLSIWSYFLADSSCWIPCDTMTDRIASGNRKLSSRCC